MAASFQAVNLTFPWDFQLELVEGCNRICSFCGINAIRTAPGNYKYMSERTLVRVCSQILDFAPTSKAFFGMHGEPLQHPEYISHFKTARNILGAKFQFTLATNGKVLMGKMQERLDALYEAGVDIIMLDTYYPERDALQEEAWSTKGFTVLDFYKQSAELSKISPYMNHHRKVRGLLIIVDDLGKHDGEKSQRVIHNHAGGNPGKPIPREPLKKTCTEPFREMSIEWDGTVNLCCEDWLRRYVLGNVFTSTLEEMWSGERIEAARAMLQNHRRDFAACQFCDAGSGMRVGFLPKYPPVTDEQLRIVRSTEQNNGRGDLIQLRTPFKHKDK